MAALVFDGREFAQRREAILAEKIRKLRFVPRLGSLAFVEDAGSMLYVRKKKQAAVRVGIEFSVEEMSMGENVFSLQEKVRVYSQREDLHGVMVQKPAKAVWSEKRGRAGGGRFENWWQQVILHLNSEKDVDCLTAVNLNKVYAGEWKIVPATVKAVVSILIYAAGLPRVLPLMKAGFDLSGIEAVVIGRSEIVGKPLAAVLRQYGAQVGLFGADLDFERIRRAKVVISAVGKPGIIIGDMIGEGAVVIDVGSPKGDVVMEEVREKAALVTPVPGGVGPVTVVSLLENLIEVLESGVD